MAGDLVAESAGVGQGTTLVFTIPLLAGGPSPPASPRLRVSSPAASDAPAIPPRPEPHLPLQPALPPPAAVSVLVAEDDPLSQTVMRKLLSRLGARFTIVDNGALAVEAFARERFQLVLLDLHMPQLDGLGAARQMCAAMRAGQAPATPLYALTASCSEEERGRCTEAGMVDLIAKPIKLDSLRALLRRAAEPGTT